MARSNWRPVGLADFARLRDARTARAYIRPKPDDSHTNLGWNDSLDGFITHPLARDHALGLRLPNLTLVLLKGEQTVQSFPLHGRSDTEARDWLGTRMTELKHSPEALDKPLPYELPPHLLAQGGRYDTAGAEPLRELAAWYSNGFHALSDLQEHLVGRGLSAPKVRLWPHHFDLDCLTTISSSDKTVGAGFSPGDCYYEEPYFYLSLYPRPDRSALPKLDPPGHWHTQDFLAAVAPAGAILALRNRQTETEVFLHSTADGFVKVLDQQTPESTD